MIATANFKEAWINHWLASNSVFSVGQGYNSPVSLSTSYPACSLHADGPYLLALYSCSFNLFCGTEKGEVCVCLRLLSGRHGKALVSCLLWKPQY